MEEYLFVNHYHWSRDEAPTTFKVNGPRAQKVETHRRYWLFDAMKDPSARGKEVWCPLCQNQHALEPLHDYQAGNPGLAARVEVGQQQRWCVVVGAGNGCFDPSIKMRRWIYAETNDDNLSADQFLEKASHEQLVADARS
jgi:hypothetical protein